MNFESLLHHFVSEEYAGGRISAPTVSQTILINAGAMGREAWARLIGDLSSNPRFLSLIAAHRKEYDEFMNRQFPDAGELISDQAEDFGMDDFADVGVKIKEVKISDLEEKLTAAMRELLGLADAMVEVEGVGFDIDGSVDISIKCSRDIVF